MNSAAQDLQEAIARHRRYLELDPRNEALRLKLSTLLLEAGDLDASADCLQAHQFGEDPAALVRQRLGIVFSLQGRWQAALALLSPALAELSPDPVALQQLTRTLHHLGRIDEAVEAAHRWLQVSPTPHAQGYCALLAADQGDTELASFLAKHALARDPENREAHLAAGQAAIHVGDPESARAHFESALATDAQCARARYGLGLVHFQQGRLDDSLRELLTAGNAQDAGTLVTAGWVQLVAGRPADARATFEAAVRQEPGFSEAHGALAAAQAMLGETAIARRTLRVAQGLHASGFGTQFAKAVLLAGEGKSEQADELLRQTMTNAKRGRSLADILASHPAVRALAAIRPANRG